MKTSILVILFLLCSQILSQIERQDIINHREFLKERKNHSSKPLEQREPSFEANSFQNNESKRRVNKAVLNNEFLLIEEMGQEWNDSNWENLRICVGAGPCFQPPGGRHAYQYNESNNLIEDLWQDWDGSSWVNFWKYTYTYDTNNNIIKDLRQDWDGSTWVNSWKGTYTYDANNNIIEDLWQGWNDSTRVNLWKSTYIYDANNNVNETLGQEWNDSSWVNHRKSTFTYDANNNMIKDLRQLWDGSNWVNLSKYSINFDMNNNKIVDELQQWGSSRWVSVWMHTYTYDVNNNLIEDLELNSRKNTYTYDANNNMIKDLYQDWDNSSWRNQWKFTYTYDANNNMIEDLQQHWHQGEGYWEIKFRILYIYQSITKIEQLAEVIESYRLLNNYPNPFNPSTKIKYSIQKQTQVTLKVYDVLGREASTLVSEEQPQGNYEVEFNASNLTSGIYFYRIQAGDFMETKKMVLLR